MCFNCARILPSCSVFLLVSADLVCCRDPVNLTMSAWSAICLFSINLSMILSLAGGESRVRLAVTHRGSLPARGWSRRPPRGTLVVHVLAAERRLRWAQPLRLRVYLPSHRRV